MTVLTVTDSEALRAPAAGEYVGIPAYGYSGTLSEIEALIQGDRVAYAARFQTLVGDFRDTDVSAANTNGPVELVATGVVDPDDIPYTCLVYGMTFRLAPDTLPGSEDAPVGTGSTADTRGALRLWTYGSGLEWALRISTIVVDGSNSVLGTAVVDTVSGVGFSWRSLDVLLPTGITAGTDICADVFVRPSQDQGAGVYGGAFRAWCLTEPDLTGVDGDPIVSIRSRAVPSNYVDVSLTAATLTAIPVTAWDAVGAFATAYLQIEVLTTGQTVQVLPAGTAQTVAPLAWQATQAGATWVSPTPVARGTISLYSLNATSVRVWWLVVTGGA